MSPIRRTSIAFGALYLITFVTSIPALYLFQPVLDDPAAYIAGPAATTPGSWPEPRSSCC